MASPRSRRIPLILAVIATISVTTACSTRSRDVVGPEATTSPIGTVSYTETDDVEAITIVVASGTGGTTSCDPPSITDVQLRRTSGAAGDGPVTGVDANVRWPQRGCADVGPLAYTIEFDAGTLAEFVFVGFHATPDQCVDVVVNRPGALAGTEPAPGLLVDC